MLPIVQIFWLVSLPIELSVNVTVSGGQPCVGLNVKSAWGTGSTFTSIVSYTVGLQLSLRVAMYFVLIFGVSVAGFWLLVHVLLFVFHCIWWAGILPPLGVAVSCSIWLAQMLSLAMAFRVSGGRTVMVVCVLSFGVVQLSLSRAWYMVVVLGLTVRVLLVDSCWLLAVHCSWCCGV